MRTDGKRSAIPVDGPEASATAQDGRAGEISDIVRISRALYDHHLLFDKVIDEEHESPRERFEAFALTVREGLTPRWVKTKSTYARENPKRVYYLSMEFLIGRSLANNVTNLLLGADALRTAQEIGLDWLDTLGQEPEAGLGNGG